MLKHLLSILLLHHATTRHMSFLPDSYHVKLNLAKSFDPELRLLSSNLRQELRTVDLFRGNVEICGKIMENTTSIVLNGWKMDVHTSSVNCSGEVVQLAGVHHEKLVDDTIIFYLAEEVGKGEECVMQITYTAAYSDLYGLYKAYFPSKFETGPRIVSIATHNEPDMNRLWIPSIDRMDTVANWTIELIHPNDTRVLAMGTVHKRRSKPHPTTTISTVIPIQPSKVAFAVIQPKHFKTYSTKGKNGTGIRFWIPRNTTFKMSSVQLLKVASDSIDEIVGIFKKNFECKVIDVVVVQHRSDVASGCLILIDTRSDFTTHKLRTQLILVLFSESARYGSVQDAWFAHSVANYLAHENFSTEYRVALLHNAVYNSMILEQPLVRPIPGAWDALKLYPSKGVLTIAMMESFMGTQAFEEMLQALVRQYEQAFFPRHYLFHFLRRYTVRSGWPECFRAFLTSHEEFVGLPVVSVNRDNGTTQLTQFNYEVRNESDPRYRNWFFTSQWTVPIFYETPQNTGLIWLNHDDSMANLTQSGLGLIDSHSKSLALVSYRDGLDDLFVAWNSTQDCSRFHRYCIDPSLNRNFCSEIYDANCTLPKLEPRIILKATRHRWDDDN